MLSPTWQVGLLHQFRLERDGEVVAEFYDRKQDLALAYLALHRDKPTPRLSLAKTLWPDRSDGLARNRLSESLHHLRVILREADAPDDFLVGNRHVVQLRPDITTDVEHFEDSVARALGTSDVEQRIHLIEEACNTYGDGLLPDVSEDWVAGDRLHHASLHRRALLQLAELIQKAGVFEGLDEFTQGVSQDELAVQWLRGRRLAAKLGTTALDLPTTPVSAVPITTWVPGRSLEDLKRKHAERCVSIAEQAESHLWSADRADWLAVLDDEDANMRAALNWALENGDRDTALRISAALWPYWQTRGEVGDGRDYLEGALSMGSPGRSFVEATAVHGAGSLAMVAGDLDTARARFDRAVVMWRDLDEPVRLARCVVNLGVIEYRRADLDGARRFIAQGIAILRSQERPDLLTRALKDAALVEVDDGELDAAEALLRERLDISRQHRDVAAAGRTLGNLATVAQLRGDLDAARELAVEALSIAMAEDDLEGIAFGLRTAGNVSRLAGDHGPARTNLEESISVSGAMGDTWAIGESRRYLADLEAEIGNVDEARVLYSSSLRSFREVGDQSGVSAVQHAIDGLEASSRS